jgi:hypothetical protein
LTQVVIALVDDAPPGIPVNDAPARPLGALPRPVVAMARLN